MLLNLIKYFNKKQMDYLASTNPIKDVDGDMPLFLHIKVKAPAFGGMQEQFRKIVNELGLEVVERRTNRNGRGLNATVQTDLYVRDTTMTIKLQKIAAQRKIKRALAEAMEEMEESTHANSNGPSSSVTSSVNGGSLTKSINGGGVKLGRQGSIRISSANLSHLSLTSLEREAQEAIQAAAKEEDGIIERGDLVEKKIEEALGDTCEVTVDVWSPWPWQGVLDKIAEHYGLTDDMTKESLEVFVAVFDKIDADGSGESSILDSCIHMKEYRLTLLAHDRRDRSRGDVRSPCGCWT